MSRVILDIETAGKNFDSLDLPVRNYLLKRAESEEQVEEIKASLSLLPLTGEIITIGLLDPEACTGMVFFQNQGEPAAFEEDGVRYETGTEQEIIAKFWETISKYDQFITFNGRCFDCPFIMVRSAVHRIRPSRDLLPNRYADAHIDLLDQLTFYGAARRKFSLDMWCRLFGIKSPKEDGIDGSAVGSLFSAGRHNDIARYCAGDLKATKELLSVWENFIKFSPAQKS